MTDLNISHNLFPKSIELYKMTERIKYPLKINKTIFLIRLCFSGMSCDNGSFFQYGNSIIPFHVFTNNTKIYTHTYSNHHLSKTLYFKYLSNLIVTGLQSSFSTFIIYNLIKRSLIVIQHFHSKISKRTFFET